MSTNNNDDSKFCCIEDLLAMWWQSSVQILYRHIQIKLAKREAKRSWESIWSVGHSGYPKSQISPIVHSEYEAAKNKTHLKSGFIFESHELSNLISRKFIMSLL